MRITLNAALRRIAILTHSALRVYDITATLKPFGEVCLERGDSVASTDAAIFVVAG